MPSWKKLVHSGSSATLNSLFVSNAVTASTFSGSYIGPLTGTASWASNASNALLASASIVTRNNVVSATGFITFVKATGSGVPDLTTSSLSLFYSTAIQVTPGAVTLTPNLGVTNIGGLSYDTSSGGIYSLTYQTPVTTGTSWIFQKTAYNPTVQFQVPIVSTSSFTANGGITGSLQGTASWANNIGTLNQNLIITGSLAVGTSSIGPSENTLTLGARDSSQEGGQIGFMPAGGTYVSSSYLDLYQDRLRVLKGNMVGSTAEVAAWSMNTLQMQLPAYTTPTSFNATPLKGLLGFDVNGNILTTSTGSGGGSSGTTFAAGNTDNRVVTATGNIPGELNGEANLTFNGSTLTVTGNITATSFTGSLRGSASYALTASYVAGVGAGGNNTYVQYNDVGALQGSSRFTYDNTNKLLVVPKLRIDENLQLNNITYVDSGNTPYTLSGTEKVIICDTSAAGIDLDLSAANTRGQVLMIKDSAGNAATNVINLNNLQVEAGNFNKIDWDRGGITMVFDDVANSYFIVGKY